MKNDKQIITSDTELLVKYKHTAECDAWLLTNEPALRVQLEQLQPGMCVQVPAGLQPQQFLYVLAGEASLQMGNSAVMLHKSEGMLLEAGAGYALCNEGAAPLRYVLTAQPGTVQFNALL